MIPIVNSSVICRRLHLEQQHQDRMREEFVGRNGHLAIRQPHVQVPHNGAPTVL